MSAVLPTASRTHSPQKGQRSRDFRSAVLAGLGWCALALVLFLAALPARAETREAIFAGGCFWCMEPPYDATEGVIATTSGFIGGHLDDPSYDQVVRGETGHTEAVRVEYDPEVVSYESLLHIFWRNIDPLARDRQFCDVGEMYRSGIFYLDESQREAALDSRQELEESGRFDEPIATEITEAGTFWPAEEYHQGYYRDNALRYRLYRWRCGRDARLEELWGDEAGGL